MILHLVSDEKYVDNLISIFDKYSSVPSKYVLLSNRLINLSIIQQKDRVKVVVIDSSEYKQLINEALKVTD